jgi:hypothetical protein
MRDEADDERPRNYVGDERQNARPIDRRAHGATFGCGLMSFACTVEREAHGIFSPDDDDFSQRRFQRHILILTPGATIMITVEDDSGAGGHVVDENQAPPPREFGCLPSI